VALAGRRAGLPAYHHGRRGGVGAITGVHLPVDRAAQLGMQADGMHAG
jgi:hypothetical protein